ncbi:catabolite repression HPr-like protein [Amphibacillus marinus]|uniref:Catabolite repression HPr-like protein n=1 Tax=Amphibacillus marinus TaxID=872970 RepID=A0A1H8RSW8_9BACI|nr:HPr family phosphocarrier protein [Amphibacillus marinus]SEO69426.1 catabolite repression HPr-like protein [Amphibacillus marinus]
MVEKTVKVVVEPGLQAGPASEFVQKSNSYMAEIFLEKGNRRVNAKSIMGLLSLAIATGDSVTLLADGPDDQEAITSLANFLTHLS